METAAHHALERLYANNGARSRGGSEEHARVRCRCVCVCVDVKKNERERETIQFVSDYAPRLP